MPPGPETVVGTDPGRPSRPRQTRQGDAVAAVLRAAGRFLSAQEVHEQLRRDGQPGGLTTVYRHLNLLAGDGRADVVPNAAGEATYRLCGTDGHHHHLVCRVCGRSEQVEAPAVERWAAKVAAEHGYTAVSHTVEVFGVCDRH